MKSIKDTVGIDWCVLITKDNRKRIRELFKPDLQSFQWTRGAYYGVTKRGTVTGHRHQEKVSMNLITEKEFFSKASSNYEIY